MCSHASATLLQVFLCLTCPPPHGLFYNVFPGFSKPNEHFSPNASFAWLSFIISDNTAYFVRASLCTCVSLIQLWTPRLEGFSLLASFLPSIPPSFVSFHPLFFFHFSLPFSLPPFTQSFIWLLFNWLFFWKFFFSFNVAEPDARITADQLQRIIRHAVLSFRKEGATKRPLRLQNMFRHTRGLA